MKSNVKENIGYISIAIVVALTLVLSVVAIDSFHNNNIVANAAYEYVGYYYGDIDTSSYILVDELDDTFDYAHHYSTSFVPNPKDLYFIEFYDYSAANVRRYGGFFKAINSYVDDEFSNHTVLGGVFLNCFDGLETTDNFTLTYYINNINDTPYFYFISDDANFNRDAAIYIYLVPNESVTDSFLSLIGDGITFGFDSIASGITYTMDNLFIVDGELTNFSVVIFLMTGISLALSVLKFVLNFIFSFGGKD